MKRGDPEGGVPKYQLPLSTARGHNNRGLEATGAGPLFDVAFGSQIREQVHQQFRRQALHPRDIGEVFAAHREVSKAAQDRQ